MRVAPGYEINMMEISVMAAQRDIKLHKLHNISDFLHRTTLVSRSVVSGTKYRKKFFTQGISEF